jgi:hypothetical protein
MNKKVRMIFCLLITAPFQGQFFCGLRIDHRILTSLIAANGLIEVIGEMLLPQ